ncbi:hypothetical protein QBC38DRAFT_490353 [Podospora fimiseda]|uniref:Secreted protein n=1 Tax=Podospora fimiseda TaxID=252190 RepID=A0AAN7BDZ4_9PEZI|nr:hypothetical protein QBC38DRAFT_490353 [Podospora fimiseda]
MLLEVLLIQIFLFVKLLLSPRGFQSEHTNGIDIIEVPVTFRRDTSWYEHVLSYLLSFTWPRGAGRGELLGWGEG